MKIKLINRTVSVNINCKMKSDYGEFFPLEDKINISSKQTKQLKRLTLCHELIHAMDYGNTNIKELSEEQVEHLSTELLYLIKHNKHLIKYLQQDSK